MRHAVFEPHGRGRWFSVKFIFLELWLRWRQCLPSHEPHRTSLTLPSNFVIFSSGVYSFFFLFTSAFPAATLQHWLCLLLVRGWLKWDNWRKFLNCDWKQHLFDWNTVYLPETQHASWVALQNVSLGEIPKVVLSGSIQTGATWESGRWVDVVSWLFCWTGQTGWTGEEPTGRTKKTTNGVLLTLSSAPAVA